MNKVEQHEIKRIRSMTDSQLTTRYGKMTKVGKMDAFLKGLQQENRHDVLQKKLKVKLGYPVGDGITVPYGVISFYLRREVPEHGYNYEYVEFNVYKDGSNTVQIIGRPEMSETKVDASVAREKWDIFINNGWERCDNPNPRLHTKRMMKE